MAATAVPIEDRPDIIVTHLASSADTVRVHLQNQGPGQARGLVHLTVSRQGERESQVRIDVPAPRKVFAVAASPAISLRSLGLKPDWTSQLLEVRLAAEQPQARTSNKDFYEQIERSSGVSHNDSHPYAEKRPALPDLVIERVYYDAPHYLKVVYANRGRGRTGADFLIGLRCGERQFPANYYYRFRIPPAGQSRTTGGYTIGFLGLKPGMEGQVTVTIDPEGRVRESNSDNNTWTGTINLK